MLSHPTDLETPNRSEQIVGIKKYYMEMALHYTAVSEYDASVIRNIGCIILYF
jgi:hypothetical protein